MAGPNVGVRARSVLPALADSVFDMLGSMPKGRPTEDPAGMPEMGGQFYNNTGGTLTAGTLVYISGRTTYGGFPRATVTAAAAATAAATWVVLADTANLAMGVLGKAAVLRVSLDTSGATVGDAVYLGAAGAPSLSSSAQVVGRVHKVSATAGHVAYNLWNSYAATTQTFYALDGSQTAPGYAFAGTGGTDDGLYRPADNQIAITLAGLKRLIVATSASPTFAAAADSVGNDVYLAASNAGLSATAARVGGLVDFRAGNGSAGTTTIAAGAGGSFTTGPGVGGSKSGTTGAAGAGGAWNGSGAVGGANANTVSGDAGAGGAWTGGGGAGGNSTNAGSTGAGGAGGVVSNKGGDGGTAAGSGAGGAGGNGTYGGGAGGTTAGGAGGTGGTGTLTGGNGGNATAGTGNGGNAGPTVLQVGTGGTSAGGTAGVGGCVLVKGTAPGPLCTLQTISALADSDATVSDADMRGGIWTVATGATNRTKTTRTSAQIVAAFPGIQIGSVISIVICNLKAANTVTLGLGTNVTAAGGTNLVVDAQTAVTFLLVATNVSGGTEAFTVVRAAG